MLEKLQCGCRNTQWLRKEYGLHRENLNQGYLNGQVYNRVMPVRSDGL